MIPVLAILLSALAACFVTLKVCRWREGRRERKAAGVKRTRPVECGANDDGRHHFRGFENRRDGSGWCACGVYSSHEIQDALQTGRPVVIDLDK